MKIRKHSNNDSLDQISLLAAYPAISRLLRTASKSPRIAVYAAKSFEGEHEPFMWHSSVPMTLLALQNRCNSEGLTLKINQPYNSTYPGSTEIILGGHNTKQVAYLYPIKGKPVIVAEIEEVEDSPLNEVQIFERPKLELNLPSKKV